MKKSLANKLGIGVAATGIILGANSLNADAQERSDYKKHDTGAAFKPYKAISDDIIEQKAIYNPAKDEDERFYIQHLDAKGRKKYEKDLDIAASPSERGKAHPMMGLKSSDADYILVDELYHFLPIEDMNKAVIEGTHVKNMCDNQAILIANDIDPTHMTNAEVNKKAQELRGDNYIFKSFVKNYMESFTGNKILELGNGDEYVVLPLPEDQQVEGKTNFILTKVSDRNHWTYEPNEENEKNLNLVINGEFFRGNLETDKNGSPASAVIDTKSGLVARLIKSDSTNNVDNAQKTIDENRKKNGTKERKKGNSAYFIIGPNGDVNGNGFGVDIGVGYGPLSVVGHFAGSKDEHLINYNIPSPNTGREYISTKDNSDISKVAALLEYRFLRDKFISPFIFGGLNKTEYNQITKEGGNENSLGKKDLSGIGGTGVSIGKNHKVDIYGAWDTRKIPELNNPNHKNSSKQLSVGVRGVIKF